MDIRKLYEWCSIDQEALLSHPDKKVPFRICEDSQRMGELMEWTSLWKLKRPAKMGGHSGSSCPADPIAGMRLLCRVLTRAECR